MLAYREKVAYWDAFVADIGRFGDRRDEGREVVNEIVLEKFPWWLLCFYTRNWGVLDGSSCTLETAD